MSLKSLFIGLKSLFIGLNSRYLCLNSLLYTPGTAWCILYV